MKKRIVRILSLMMVAVMLLSLAACGGKEGDDADGRRILKWEVLKAGYGSTAYEKVAEAFMEENPDILVKINFNPSIVETTASRLESNTNLADVYSYRDIEAIKRWTASGYVEPLDELFGEELSTGKTISESLTGKAEEVCSYNGSVYAIPEYVSVNGMVYNKTLFDKYGWEVPTTTAELDKLCKKILADTDKAVAPIVYCGGAADGYLYFAVENWSSQYEGISQLDTFFKYENAEVFNPNTYKGKMYALQNLSKFFYDEGNYTMTGSTGMTHIVAQSKLIQGEAAMMLNGSWFETEMSEVLAQNPDVEIGMFPVPQLSDSQGNVLHSANYTTEDDKRVVQASYGAYYFVPSQAENKEDAMKFMKFLSEPDTCVLYTRYSNAVRPFDYELSPDAEVYADVSYFGKDILKFANENYLYTPSITNPIAIKGLTGFWARGRAPYVDIRDNIETTNQALQNDYEYAKKNWNSWLDMVE